MVLSSQERPHEIPLALCPIEECMKPEITVTNSQISIQ